EQLAQTVTADVIDQQRLEAGKSAVGDQLAQLAAEQAARVVRGDLSRDLLPGGADASVPVLQSGRGQAQEAVGADGSAGAGHPIKSGEGAQQDDTLRIGC